MSDRLVFRDRPDDARLQKLEEESIDLFHDIKAAIVPGPWEASPVEEEHQDLRELFLTTPGELRRFRRSYLSIGRIRYPDAPRSEEHYLQWDNRLAGQKWAGAWQLLKMAIRLYRHRPFSWKDLDDNLVGQPTTYCIPKSLKAGLTLIASHCLKLKNLKEPQCYHLTSVQLTDYPAVCISRMGA